MLTIRADQMRTLEADLFERWMVSHMRRYFPGRCAARGDADLRRLIRAGIAKAGAYGLDARPDLRRFIDLMLVLGESFDTDPDLPWAATVLNEPDLTDPVARLELLHSSAREYLKTGNVDWFVPPADEPPVLDLDADEPEPDEADLAVAAVADDDDVPEQPDDADSDDDDEDDPAEEAVPDAGMAGAADGISRGGP